MPAGSTRITKKRWSDMGGLRNSKLWRRQVGRAWHYFISVS